MLLERKLPPVKNRPGRDGERPETLLAFEQAALPDLARFPIFDIPGYPIDDRTVAPDAEGFATVVSETDRLEDGLRPLLGHIRYIGYAERGCR